MFSFPAVRMQVVILTDEIKHKLLIQRRDALIDVSCKTQDQIYSIFVSVTLSIYDMTYLT